MPPSALLVYLAAAGAASWCAFLPPYNAQRRPPARERALATATAHWRLGDAASIALLRRTGHVESGVAADATRATIARLNEGCFDAGPDLTARDQVTVYLRARDPRGLWQYALFSKRGSHETVNFNLFSVDLGGTPGPDIGFEVHTDAGFVMVSFPVSQITPTEWHDLAGRYDGRKIELLCDGRIMATRRWRGRLTQNREPVLIGGETDQGRVTRLFRGEMEEAALWQRALSNGELAAVMRRKAIMPDASYMEPYASPINYRPETGRLADTIPFYWKGQYHIFYLRAVDKVPWEHIVSTDLIHWKELPTALVSDGKQDGPDGLHMFTGSVAEKDGTFHIFYTGWNPANPAGREFIMHATGSDLIHWTKQPEDILAPDGRYYSAAHDRDFRDPYVFWNADARQFWMLFCSGSHTGLAVSNDLRHWQFQPPIQSDYGGMGTPECPDYFRIGETHYLICSPTATSSTIARHAPDIRGPYTDPVSRALDTPILYAAKRMFDGKRHILTGWLRDLEPERDSGAFQWGGTQSVPRELYAGPSGQIFCRPVPEAAAVFTRTVLDLARRPAPKLSSARAARTPDGLQGSPEAGGSQRSFDAPPNYMLQCRVKLSPKAVFTLAMREGSAAGSGYRLTLRPDTQEAEIAGVAFRYPRRILLDASRPIAVTAFVQGTLIECFVNDAFAFSCRAYDYRSGRLALTVTNGTVDVLDIKVKTPGSGPKR